MSRPLAALAVALAGPVLARARTVWVPIDPATGRPKRVSDRVRKMFSVE